MKKISILLPTYNEYENAAPIALAVENELKKLTEYDYEILFIDNCSTDGTRDVLRELCAGNKKIKAIFNAKNFGQNNSPYYGLCQATGDCVIGMCADFQDPVDMIPKLVEKWEEGYKIVSAVKSKSRENKIMRLLRTIYYKMIKKFSTVEQIEHFTGFGLYDRSFIEVMKNLHDPTPYLRGIVAELGFKKIEVPYEQQKRRFGKSKNNFFTLYDMAMLSFTSYTTIGLRLASFIGYIVAFISLVIAVVYLVYKLLNWETFNAGMAPVLIGMCFIGAVQLVFMGFMGEYLISMNKRIMNRPLVVEEERLNFEDGEGQ